jgi:hypothetical protein
LSHPKTHEKLIPKTHSLHDHKPILGANGHGIWLEKYKPESMRDPVLMDN